MPSSLRFAGYPARVICAVLGFSLGSLVFGGCGAGGDGSLFTKKTARESPAGAAPGDPGAELSGDSASTTDRTSSVDPSSACATSSAKAEGAPVYLVIMFDKSGSMLLEQRWTSATAAMRSFFADANSVGLSASLHFFPGDDGPFSGIDDPEDCRTSTFETPAVPMTSLPNATAFASAMSDVQPFGGTPTLPALEGALAYARTAQSAHADGKVVVVLVTDGEPDGCSSTVRNVSEMASAAAATIPTYVIGVGNGVSALNQVAAAGGTKQAVIVSTLNPSKIREDFGNAIADIRLKALSCDYKVPKPPNNETFDIAKVNVQFTPGSGAATTLAYNRDCTGGAGWRYDSVSAPTQILVCPSSCETFKADAKGKVDVLFGCATKGGVIK